MTSSRASRVRGLGTHRRRITATALGVAVLLLGVASAVVLLGHRDRGGGAWPLPNADLSGTRSAAGSAIDSSNVSTLTPAWRFPLRGYQTPSGVFASTPITLDGRVFIQDLDSNVFALDAGTGGVIWTAHVRQVSGGPNGLSAAGGRIYGNTRRGTFALDQATGKVIWRRRLVLGTNQTVDIAPQVANGLVYTSTDGLLPGGKGVLYALDAATGHVRWRFDTIRGNWAVPGKAAGGGAWWPASVSADGTVYVGTSNPLPWGGTPALPNGAAYGGRALYTDSLLALDGASGALRWYRQATPHDVRDYDFSASPILARAAVDGTTRNIVYGAGKAGVVYAFDATTGHVYWKRPVGLHRNDLGPLPDHRVLVCPGLYGGVETPMAYADGRVFVPVVDLCMRGSATGYEPLQNVDIATRGRGELTALDAATGRPVWTRHFRVPVFACATVANDVVFTATFDGHVYGLAASSGRILWEATVPAAVNACPSVDGNQLLVGAGADFSTLTNERYELVAFQLSR
jgi:outer membrane protein assembly factor BamB